jgi:hypothetical protein
MSTFPIEVSPGYITKVRRKGVESSVDDEYSIYHLSKVQIIYPTHLLYNNLRNIINIYIVLRSGWIRDPSIRSKMIRISEMDPRIHPLLIPNISDWSRCIRIYRIDPDRFIFYLKKKIFFFIKYVFFTELPHSALVHK